MEFTEVVRRRRMVRRFDPDRPVPEQTVRDLVALAVRAPSAGFSQGWEFLALLSAPERARFWNAAGPAPLPSPAGEPSRRIPRSPRVRQAPEAPSSTPPQQPARSPDPWLVGVGSAPALVLCLADPAAYLDRYAEPDKGWTDRSLDHWPIPYWDTDTAMAALLILLGATDRGIGSLFFGVPADRHEAVKVAHGIPGGLRIVGVVALGHEVERVRSPSLRRGRRDVDAVLHVGGFGESAPDRSRR